MVDRRQLEREQERLATFRVWPSNAPVSANDLVKNGFFATGNWLEAECNWCHLRIDMWEYGDQVADRHRRSSPICSMVLAPNHCGNVPIDPTDAEGNNVLDGGNVQQNQCDCPDLLLETNRLETFKNWPNPNVTPQALAKAGFYYLNRDDEVKCAWCHGVMAQWEKNDNAFDEHQRIFPNCPRVQMGPLIEFVSKDLGELGIQPTSVPKKPKYACLETRLRSFCDWPLSSIQSADALAQAGLYYQRIDDQVRCFHCNIGLRAWEKEDDPWHEHAKWSPNCQFVLLAKGPTYVRQIGELTATARTAATAPIQPGNVDDAMSEEPARQALALGIDGGVVRSTIQRKMSHSGQAYDTLDELLHAIFDEAGGTDAALELTEPTAPPEPECNATTSKAAAAALDLPIAPEIHAATSDAHVIVKPPSAKSMAKISLEEENRQLKDARLCKVCLDDEVGVVFLPCGHLATCNQCAPSVANCPMCRSEIKGFVRTFLS